MVPIPEVRRRDADRARIRFAPSGLPGPGISGCPAGVCVFPCRPGGTVRPDTGRAPARSPSFPAIRRRGARTEAASTVRPPADPWRRSRSRSPKSRGQGRERIGPGQPLPKRPDRLSVRSGPSGPRPGKPRPARAVPERKSRPPVARAINRRRPRNPGHRHRVTGKPAALRPVPVTGRFRQYRAKGPEIHMTSRSLGRTARPRQAFGMVREIKSTGAERLQVLPNPVNRNTYGKAGFLEASDCSGCDSDTDAVTLRSVHEPQIP